MMQKNRKYSNSAVAAGVILILAGLAPACSDRPKEVLSEKEMVSLMADMQLAESYANSLPHSSDSEKEREEMGEAILKQHGVSREQLDTTLAWYGRNFDDYNLLYEKVDKEIISRRKKMMKGEEERNVVREGDMLWPFGQNGLLTNLGTTDSWILSIPNPDIEKGDRLVWTMHANKSSDLTGVLGVEYEDGSGENNRQNMLGRNKVEITLQTDTGKIVKRIYGTIRLKDRGQMPLFTDSIQLRRLPYDSLEYSRVHGQRRYANAVKVEKVTEKSDTTKTDSVAGNKRELNLQPISADDKPMDDDSGSEKPKRVDNTSATKSEEVKWKPRKK